MILGQDAFAGGVRHHGRAQRLGQGAHVIGQIVGAGTAHAAADRVGAGQNERLLGVAQQGGRFVESRGQRGGFARWRRCRSGRGSVLRCHQVGRDFETHRPGPARPCRLDRAPRGGVQVVGPLGDDDVFRDRAEQRALFLQLVQHAQPFADLGRLDVGRHHQHRRATAPRLLQGRDGEAGARPGRRDDRAQTAAGPRVAVGHVRGRGLVAAHDVPELRRVAQRLVQADVVDAGDAEDGRGAGFGQGVQDSVRGAGHTLSVSPRIAPRRPPRGARPPRRRYPTRAGSPPCAGPASAAASAPRPASSSVSRECRRP